jgi:hypothetical protein
MAFKHSLVLMFRVSIGPKLVGTAASVAGHKNG